ncbi:hypothetical protein ACFYO0_44995 [Streptomyces sp. NPDC006365]|uniref:hypothetical protein n=1 Tax=Streptomyces sp. NPDC006365 TaxID=3364744 RepID=UPI0036B53EBA
MLRAAPLLTQHHLQRPEQALVVVDGSRQGPNQRKFTREFAKEVRKAGITKPTYRFKTSSHPKLEGPEGARHQPVAKCRRVDWVSVMRRVRG